MRIQLSKLESVFGASVHTRNFGRSERFVVEVEFTRLLEVAAWLRMEETFRMDFLETFSVYEAKGKFTLSYFVRSLSQNLQLVIRSSVSVPGAREGVNIPSMIGIWPSAEPFETELSPLFGIQFTGTRPTGDVRKIFGTFAGFPLRKAFEWQEGFQP